MFHSVARIHLFAVTRLVGIVLLEAVLLLAVLGVLAGEYGAFQVVWYESPQGTWWPVRAIVWNGFGVAVFFGTTGYLTYLLYCHEKRLPGKRGLERLSLYGGKATLPLVVAVLPAVLPTLFVPTSDRRSSLELYADHLPFLIGAVAGALAFVGAVSGLTWVSTRIGPAGPGGPPFQGKLGRWLAKKLVNRVWPPRQGNDSRSLVDQQTDMLFAAVLFGYAALAGYTLGDATVAPPAWSRVGLPVAVVFAIWLLLDRARVGTFAVLIWLLMAAALYGYARYTGDAQEAEARRIWLAAAGLLMAARLTSGAWALAHQRPDPFARQWAWRAVWASGGAILLATFVHGWRVGWAWEWGYLLSVLLVAIVCGLLHWGLRTNPDTKQSVEKAAAAAFLAAAGGLTGLAVGHLNGWSGVTLLPATLSLCLLLAAVVVGYGLLWVYSGRWFYPTMAALAGWVVLIGSVRPYPHQIEELAEEYTRADVPARKGAKFDLANYVADRESADLLQSYKLLPDWRRAAELPSLPIVAAAGGASVSAIHRPPLVIVTTAGGASVSAIYTYNILTCLEQRIPGFHRHVRLVTGASGGMLGAAYYRAVLSQYYRELDRGNAMPELSEYLASRRHALDEDFLSPIVQALAFKDIPMWLGCPFGYSDDRGRRLERAWTRFLGGALDVTFHDLREEERSGRFPSLVFSPMMVEDGRPLLISTIDLDWSAVPVDVGYVPVKGVELMRLFPESGWRLRLGTAVRLSASFPYFSPAVTLPTIPPRRLVDAGYLDNFGMGVALSWVGEHVRYPGGGGRTPATALQDVTSRVIILELRPYGTFRTSVLTDAEWRNGRDRFLGTEKSGRVPAFVDPLQELTSPPSGAGAARKAGMIGRNNDQFEALRQLLGKSGGTDNFLNKVTFNGELEVSLNWTLSRSERETVRDQVEAIFDADPAAPMEPGERSNRQQLNELLKMLGRR